ncbi:hypothetical protein KNJ79_05350 [Sphingopyxis indica]|uniref:hypothetical protein n=1 Tax=Sphingopyxis indica TaxID=436663 RepID=UPI002939526B|nr:hypothetical protein [Sphingopyxis indica]WOF44359.1 hypothetical protein KNJ79_05350 [Sphingopyxis indica]
MTSVVSLASVTDRFLTPIQVIAGGIGTVFGVISETDQTQVPSYIFVPPRHVLRTRHPTPVRLGMVIRTPAGEVFIVGDNGPSEHASGTLWDSYRLFRATHQLQWKRRTYVVDPVTKQKADAPPANMGLIWVGVEPTDREENERRMNTTFERARFITAANVQADDLLGEYEVIRSDTQLGLQIGFLQT